MRQLEDHPTALPKPELAAVTQSGPALFAWRRARGFSRALFARVARLSERTLANYEVQELLPAQVQGSVTEAVRLIEALLELIPGEQLASWLQAPNSGFRGSSPLEVIAAGKRDLIWQMVYRGREMAFA